MAPLLDITTKNQHTRQHCMSSILWMWCSFSNLSKHCMSRGHCRICHDSWIVILCSGPRTCSAAFGHIFCDHNTFEFWLEGVLVDLLTRSTYHSTNSNSHEKETRVTRPAWLQASQVQPNFSRRNGSWNGIFEWWRRNKYSSIPCVRVNSMISE